MDALQFMKHRADLESLMMSAGTVFAGTAAAVIRGNMEILVASICLLFALFLQVGCNLYHYYLYFRRTQAGESLPSAKIETNEMVMRMLREGSYGCLILSLMLGFTLMAMADFWWALLLGIIVYGLVYLMARTPRINRNPASLIITFLVFGPIGVIGTVFVQYQYEAHMTVWNLYDAGPSLFLGPSMGFLACSHHLAMSYFSTSIDPDKTRPGIIRAIGRRGVEWLIGFNGVASFLILVAMVYYLGFTYPLVALVPGFMGFCLNTYIACRLHCAGLGEQRYLNSLSRINFLLTAILCFVIWWIIGTPDDSIRVIF